MQRFGSPSGWGIEVMTVASAARIVMKKLGNSSHPWLSVIWASVSPSTSKPRSVSVSRVACWSSVRPVTPSGYCDLPVVVAVLLDQLLEARQVAGDGRERVREAHGALRLVVGGGVGTANGAQATSWSPQKRKRFVVGSITIDLEQLRVDRLDVVALLERVDDDLPVAVDGLAHVEHRDHLVEVVRLDQLVGIGAEELGERHRIGVGVEEDETGEGVDGHLEQSELGLVEVADEIGAGDATQAALKVVGPEVVRADEAVPVLPVSLATQHVAAMSAGVDEPAEHAVLAAHDEERLVVDRVLLPVAGVGDLVDAGRRPARRASRSARAPARRSSADMYRSVGIRMR